MFFSLWASLFPVISNCPMSIAIDLSPDIKILVNNEILYFPDQQPFIDHQNNRIYVPLRTIAENLGASVSWNQGSRLINIKQTAKTIEISLDSGVVMINRQAVAVDVPTLFINGYTMVPLRFVSEALEAKVEWDANSHSIRINKYLPLKILSLQKPGGTFTPGNAVNTSLLILNNSSSDNQFWLSYSFKNPAGKFYDIKPRSLALKAGEKRAENLSWLVPNNKDMISGEYDLYIDIWDKNPADSTAQRLLSYDFPAQIRIFRYIDNFDNLDSSLWEKGTNKLGLSQLNPKNIKVDNSILTFKMPANTTEGAEIRSRKTLSYGSYEVNMKLPNLPASITGFFLYQPPDLYHEIDIEIYNRPDGKIMFTLYSQGRKSKEVQMILPFDPTADFHCYRFDFLAEELSFYVDDILLQKWTEGFSTRPMKLMLNSWFPDWLDGKKASEDKYLEVNWIRY